MTTPQNQNVLRVARGLYATYCASSEGKNFQGNPCPSWNALPEAVRGHWYTVAKRACVFAAAAVKTCDPDAAVDLALVIDLALVVEPSQFVVGHLPDPASAVETWRFYATDA